MFIPDVPQGIRNSIKCHAEPRRTNILRMYFPDDVLIYFRQNICSAVITELCKFIYQTISSPWGLEIQ